MKFEKTVMNEIRKHKNFNPELSMKVFNGSKMI